MKTIKENFTKRALTISVQGALAAMLVMPLIATAEETAKTEAAPSTEAEALKRPSNFVEIGAMNVVHDSAKFGEYNGLNDSGVYAVGNFDIRGGDAYEEGDGTMRYEAQGTNLGTSSRALGATVSNQGKWSAGIGYDELRHYLSDSYQTPFQGAMGGSTFRLPGDFGIINTSLPANTTATGGARGLTANQKSYFHDEDVYTDRKNKSVNFGYNFDPQWNVQLDYNRLDQTGSKLISSATEARPDGIHLVIPPGTAGTGSTTSNTNNRYYAGQAVMLLMNPTNYQTDTVNAALNWTGEKGRLSLGYFGSFFSDKNSSLSWSNPFTANNGTGRASATGTAAPNGFPVSTMSTTPDNQFNQVNLTGGYDFSPATKLAGGLSYGRNTQDDSFLTNMMPSGLPRNSLDGEVITKNANLKLTNQATKELALTAGFKYNERDNKTSSKSYDFTLVDGAGALDDATNIPFSNKRYQFELAGDYRFNSSNNLRVAYEYNRIKRWCSDTGPDCVKAEDNTDNTVGLEYRLKASDTVSLNAGYSYADRNANNNGDLNWESTIGENDLNVSGFVPYFEASRKEQIAKAGVNWQATDRLDLGLTGRYIYDNYDEKLGLQNSDAWSLNLDATFSYSENGSVSAYASIMKRWRDMKNANVGNIEATPVQPPSNLWTNRLSDDEDAFGLSARHKGLMGGKLSLAGDVSYVYGNSGYTTNLSYTPATLCTSSVPGATNYNLACGSTPDITNRTLQVKLSGDYQVDKHSKIALGYLYQQLHSNDYYYNGYQTGYTSSTLLPTNEQEQSYSVNVVTATYTYEF